MNHKIALGLLFNAVHGASISNEQSVNSNTYACEVDSSYNCYDETGVAISWKSNQAKKCYKEGGDSTQAAINCGPSHDGDTVVEGAERLAMFSMGAAFIALLNF